MHHFFLDIDFGCTKDKARLQTQRAGCQALRLVLMALFGADGRGLVLISVLQMVATTSAELRNCYQYHDHGKEQGTGPHGTHA